MLWEYVVDKLYLVVSKYLSKIKTLGAILTIERLNEMKYLI